MWLLWCRGQVFPWLSHLDSSCLQTDHSVCLWPLLFAHFQLDFLKVSILFLPWLWHCLSAPVTETVKLDVNHRRWNWGHSSKLSPLLGGARDMWWRRAKKSVEVLGVPRWTALIHVPKGIGYMLFLRTRKGKTLICFRLVSILRKHGILMFIIITNCMHVKVKHKGETAESMTVCVCMCTFFLFFFKRERGGGGGGGGCAAYCHD